MGDNRLPKRVMSGELENAGNVGRGGRRKNGQTALQRIRASASVQSEGKLLKGLAGNIGCSDNNSSWY